MATGKLSKRSLPRVRSKLTVTNVSFSAFIFKTGDEGACVMAVDVSKNNAYLSSQSESSIHPGHGIMHTNVHTLTQTHTSTPDLLLFSFLSSSLASSSSSSSMAAFIALGGGGGCGNRDVPVIHVESWYRFKLGLQRLIDKSIDWQIFGID